MAEPTQILLGVDGGGTKTAAWLARADRAGDRQVVGRGAAGPSNPRTIGLDAALANLAAAVAAAWQDAGQEPQPAAAAVLAIAGAGDPAVGAQIHAAASASGLAAHIELAHDADAVLAAGAPADWGVALIAGTGSSAVAVDRTGNRIVVGGWGAWYGDEGSGFWIGREALRAATRASDGRGEATALGAEIAAALGLADLRHALAALNDRGDVRRGVAQLAPLACRAAAAGDPAALRILAAAAAELALLVCAAAEKLVLGNQFPLAMAGGLLCGSELLRDKLSALLAQRQLTPAPLSLVSEPVAGCLELAARAVQRGSPGPRGSAALQADRPPS